VLLKLIRNSCIFATDMPDLVYRIKETLTLNGKVVGNDVTKTVSGINSYHQAVVNVGTSAPVNLLAFAATEAFGTIADGTLRYLRITNLAASATVNVTFTAGTDTVVTTIGGGASLVLTYDSMNIDGVGMTQLDSITGVASAAADVEIFVATT
jgi:hypothetical protein